jgi:hypothetical protein
MTRFVAKKRRHTVSAPLTSFTYARLAGAVAALWLCGAGAAWAGDGGADLQSLQALLSTPNTGFCAILKMTSCPQLPTITQAVLEVAGLTNSPPEMVAAQNSISPGSNVNAGNPAAVPTDIPVDSNTGLATLPLATTTPNTSEVLAALTPLAFISKSSGTAAATRLYDPNANIFLYAVGVSSVGEVSFTGLTDPDMVYFFYDDPSRTNSNLQRGNIVAKFLLPLTVLSSNGVETPVSATLQFKVPAAGQPPCSASTVVSSLWPMGIAPAQVGLNCAVVFSGSPASAQQHAIFEVAVPLLVTQATDPAYSYSLNKGLPGPINTAIYTAFGFAGDDLGATLPNGASIGLAPSAGPLGPPPAAGVSSTLALCATLPVGNGNGQAPVPAVGAYYAIATDGETLLSAALPAVSTSTCPPL